MKLDPSGRIALEPLTAAHAEELCAVLSDHAIYQYIPVAAPASVTALADHYRRLETRVSPDGSQRWLNWAIRRLADRQCVGLVQATVHPAQTADIAFVLGSAYWGLGLAHEASLHALWHLFEECEVTAVYATADRRNTRSCNLLTRLGFARISPEIYLHGTVEESDDAFQLTRQEYARDSHRLPDPGP